MKKIQLMIAAIAFISLSACSQTSVPKNVNDSFSQKFPNAKKVKWDKENALEWEAEFKLNDKKYSANFDVDGTWKETEYEINKSDIPATVKSTLAKEFNGYKIEDAEVSETPEGKVFEFGLENHDTDMEVAIDTNGKVIKKKVKEEDNEEGDEEGEKEDKD